MEIFFLLCLAILAAIVVFWLFIFPAGLLCGAVVSIGRGIIEGFRGALKPRP